MVQLIDEHRRYVGDAARLAAYDRALRVLVRPGDVVIDLASGTGVLGLLACRAGASRVYAIEVGPVAELARRFAEANGWSDRIVRVRSHSARATLPELGDLLVADQMGPFGIDAGIVDMFADARARLLRPAAQVVPATIELVVAPISDSRTHGRITSWRKRPAGFDMSAALEASANTVRPIRIRGDYLLGDPVRLVAVDLAREPIQPLCGRVVLRVSRTGVLHGVGGWFDATLAPSITLTNSPVSPERIDRRQAFFPLDEPVAVREGDTVDTTLRILPSDGIYAWDVVVSRQSGAPRRFRQSTLRGLLLDRDALRRMAPGVRPGLTAYGQARLTVLRLCESGTTLGDLERMVYDRHRDVFADPAHAARFVAEVVARDTH